MSEAAPTPTPWKRHYHRMVTADVIVGHCIENNEQGQANAAFIVEAVNSHATNKAVVDAAQQVIDNWQNGDLAAAVRGLDTAIQKTRGP